MNDETEAEEAEAAASDVVADEAPAEETTDSAASVDDSAASVDDSAASVDDSGDDEDDAAHGDADAPTAKAVLEYVVSSLVSDVDAVQVDVDDSKRTLQLEVRVGPDDMGRVIGRRGRVANAIRTLTRAAAAKDGVEVDIEFLD